MKATISAAVFIISLIFNPIYSQEKKNNQETFAKFQIIDWIKNGTDMTPVILDEKAFLVIYKNTETNELMMANYWLKSNSQSYGAIYNIEKKHLDENNENYAGNLFSFQWVYINTYDQKKGTAKVELLEVYKPQGTYFKMTIIPENLDILVYQGYVEGSLDLSVYERKN